MIDINEILNTIDIKKSNQEIRCKSTRLDANGEKVITLEEKYAKYKELLGGIPHEQPYKEEQFWKTDNNLNKPLIYKDLINPKLTGMSWISNDPTGVYVDMDINGHIREITVAEPNRDHSLSFSTAKEFILYTLQTKKVNIIKHTRFIKLVYKDIYCTTSPHEIEKLAIEFLGKKNCTKILSSTKPRKSVYIDGIKYIVYYIPNKILKIYYKAMNDQTLPSLVIFPINQWFSNKVYITDIYDSLDSKEIESIRLSCFNNNNDKAVEGEINGNIELLTIKNITSAPECIQVRILATAIKRNLYHFLHEELNVTYPQLVQTFEDPSILTKQLFYPTLSRVKIHTLPIELINLAYSSHHAPWVDVFKIGRFKELYDYDINSSYPHIIKTLKNINVEYGNWKEVFKYNKRSTYGFYIAIINVKNNISHNPIMFRYENNSIAITGTWLGTITKDEIEFIYKWGLGTVRVLEGYEFCENTTRIEAGFKYPYKHTMNVSSNRLPFKRSITRFYNLRQKKVNDYSILKTGLKNAAVRFSGLLMHVTKPELENDEIDGTPELNRTFNPILYTIILTKAKLALAEYVMKNTDKAVAVVVDGLLTDKEIKLENKDNRELGKLRLNSKSKGGLIFSKANIYSGEVRNPEFGLRLINTLNYFQHAYTMSNEVRIRLKDTLQDNTESKIESKKLVGRIAYLNTTLIIGRKGNLTKDIIIHADENVKQLTWPSIGSHLIRNNYRLTNNNIEVYIGEVNPRNILQMHNNNREWWTRNTIDGLKIKEVELRGITPIKKEQKEASMKKTKKITLSDKKLQEKLMETKVDPDMLERVKRALANKTEEHKEKIARINEQISRETNQDYSVKEIRDNEKPVGPGTMIIKQGFRY